MADTSERPTNVTTTAPLAASGPPPADLPRDEPYRPLSLLAVLGFVLAAAYAFLVLLGGLVPIVTQYPRLSALLAVAAPLVGAQAALLSRKKSAGRVAASAGVGLMALLVVLGVGGLLAYSGTNPWLFLAGAGWFMVAAAVTLCWLARSHIAASEGTLGGAALANWGLVFSLVSGLIYGAYLASNTFAVRSQAQEAAMEFIRLIADKNDPESLRKAFVLTLPVRARPTSDLRREIEIQHNVTQDPSGRMSGPYNQFRNSQYVQLMRMGVDKVSFERVNLNQYDRGGYMIGLIYRIETPVGTVFLQVGTQGVEVAEGGTTRRRWQVMAQGTKLDDYRPNAKAKQFEAGARIASGLVTEWINRLKGGDAVTAYLLSLPEAERTKQVGAASVISPAVAGLTGVALPGALATTNEVRDAFAKGLAEYRAGKAIDIQTHDFFAAPDKPGTDTSKKQMIADVKSSFRGDGPLDLEFGLSGSPPAFDEAGGGSSFLFPVRIVTRPRGKGHPSYMIEAEVQVIAPLPEKAAAKDYRVGPLRLIRGQETPSPSKG